MAQNFTPIDYPINPPTYHPTKESEPTPHQNEDNILKETIEYVPEDGVGSFIEVKPGSIDLPPDMKKMGIQTNTSTKFPSYQNVKTPLADDKVLQGLNAPFSSSLRWLAELAMYILRRAHLVLKKVHGHAVRVIKI